MTKLILIRHGVTTWNAFGRFQGQSDVQLAPEGVHQARLLTAHFPIDEVAAIYSSDLSRARMTAEVLNNRFNVGVQTDPRLREANYGVWEAQNFKDLAEKYPLEFKKFFLDPDEFQPEGAESMRDVQARALSAINEIVRAHIGKNIVIVSHGALIRTVIADILEMPLRKLWAIKQFNTAANIICLEDGVFSIELLNSTEHLKRA